MKRLFYMMLISIAVIMLWGCTKNGTEDEPTPPISYLEFSEETDISPEFEAKGGTSKVSFITSHDWTANANQSWITLSRKSGTPQITYFNITVSKNSSTSKRTGTVTITADNKSYKINVSQQGAEKAVFEFSSDTDTTPEFEAKGGTSKVSFTTSHDWTANANQSWISLSRKSGTTSNSNFTITVSENTSTSQRTGAVTITSNSKSYKVSISQKGKEENKDIPYNTIYYKSTDGKIVTPYAADVFGANIASNIYANGEGIITFDGDVTNVGTAAFKGCSTLTEIILPNSVIDIESNAFFSCLNLKLFYGKFASEDNRCLVVKGELKCLSPQVEGNYTLPSSITSLGMASLSCFRKRVSITIPNSVTSLSDVCCTSTRNVEKFYGKFATANNLALVKDNILYGVAVYGQTSYVISDGVTTIMENVFQNCTNLQSITLPSSINNIGKIAFNSCTSLTTLYCKANTPPQIESNSNIFRDIETTPTIYVPQKSVDTYKSASGWSKYASYIKGYDFTDEPVESTFEFSSDTDTTPEFTAEGGTSKVAFTTSHDWTASVNQGWISLSRKSGTPSTSNFTITVSENTSTSQRTGVVTITSDNKSYKVNVTQEGAAKTVFEFSSDTDTTPEFTAEGGTSKVAFTTSHDWTASANQGWISLSRKSGTPSTSNFTITVSENTSTSQRTGVVTITSNSKSYKVNVTQNGRSDIIVFKDANVKYICVANYDTNNDEEISYSEAESVTTIGTYIFRESQIVSFPEFKYFKNVKTIEGGAFFGCKTLTNIEIPNSVTSIGISAFYNCTNLSSVNIPTGVTTIESTTFYQCSKLTQLSIPSSITQIGYSAFMYSGLTSIVLPNSLTSIGEKAFYGTSITSIEIPSNVYWIKNYAFCSCGKLSNITIQNGVSYIGEGAFAGCKSLTNITIPNSVTSMGDYVFQDCTSLSNIVIGEGVVSIGAKAFDGCKGTLSMYGKFIESDFYYDDFRNPSYWLYGSNFTEIIIGGAANKIGNNILTNYGSLTSVAIGNSITSIGESAFSSCKNLASVTIGNSVTVIGDNAFSGCSSLTSITIPDNVIEIGDGSFVDCKALANIKMSKNTITIGRAAFRNCAISKISISDNVKSIGEDAFLFCFNLRRVDISNLSSWCKIDFANKYANPLHTKDSYVYDPSGAKLFINNVEEYNITIPLDVKEIKDYAFCGCTSIGWVEIHKDITRIGSYAFRDCTKLQTVKCYPTTPPATGEKVFYHDYIYHTNLLEIWVPTASYNQYVYEWGSGKVVDSSDIVGKLTY